MGWGSWGFLCRFWDGEFGDGFAVGSSGNGKGGVEEAGPHADLLEAEAGGEAFGGREVLAVVGDGEDELGGFLDEVDPDMAGMGVLDGVGNGFADDAEDVDGLGAVEGGWFQIGVDFDFGVEELFGAAGEGFERVGKRWGVEFGEGEIVGIGAGDAGEAGGLFTDEIERLAAGEAGFVGLDFDGFGEAGDADEVLAEAGVDVFADAAGFAFGGDEGVGDGLAQLLFAAGDVVGEMPVGVAQFLLGLLEAGDVVGGTDVGDNLVLLVHDRHDAGGVPEELAGFVSNAVFDAALEVARLDDAGKKFKAGGMVIGQNEGGKVLSDNEVRGMAEQAGPVGGYVGENAFGRDGIEDGVGVVEQQFIALFEALLFEQGFRQEAIAEHGDGDQRARTRETHESEVDMLVGHEVEEIGGVEEDGEQKGGEQEPELGAGGGVGAADGAGEENQSEGGGGVGIEKFDEVEGPAGFGQNGQGAARVDPRGGVVQVVPGVGPVGEKGEHGKGEQQEHGDGPDPFFPVGEHEGQHEHEGRQEHVSQIFGMVPELFAGQVGGHEVLGVGETRPADAQKKEEERPGTARGAAMPSHGGERNGAACAEEQNGDVQNHGVENIAME